MDRTILLDSYQKALVQLEKALLQPAEDELLQAGCIQYFEFCFELAWKTVKTFSADYGSEECLSPKACLKLAFAQGWIEHEAIWLDMLAARNRMSHTYDIHAAIQVYHALSAYLPQLQHLAAKLRSLP